MAHVAEKARFFLEKAAPQLREFEEKGIFTRDEIRTLVRTRSEYEHRVLAPGPTPNMWLDYIEWDINLEKLRAHRCRKLHIHNSTSYAGETRILKTLDRAVDRHPGSMELWRRYLDYAEYVNAGNRWNKVWTRAIRLHPQHADLWIRGAHKMIQNGNMEKARERFMYGCRNCKRENAPKVWVEYARSELEWLAKTESKLQLGQYELDMIDDTIEFGRQSDEDDGNDDGPGDDKYGEVLAPTREQRLAASETVAQKLAKSAALKGALPKAVFDVARKQEFFTSQVALLFWDGLSSVTQATKAPAIAQHVLNAMEEMFPRSAETEFCRIRTPLVGLKGRECAIGMKSSLALLATSLKTCDEPDKLVLLISQWIDEIAEGETMDTRVVELLRIAQSRLQSSAV